jgi:hypothetical protein
VEASAGEPNRTSASASMEVSQPHSVVLPVDSDGTKNNKTSSSDFFPLSLVDLWEVPKLKISKTLVT